MLMTPTKMKKQAVQWVPTYGRDVWQQTTWHDNNVLAGVVCRWCCWWVMGVVPYTNPEQHKDHVNQAWFLKDRAVCTTLRLALCRHWTHGDAAHRCPFVVWRDVITKGRKPGGVEISVDMEAVKQFRGGPPTPVREVPENTVGKVYGESSVLTWGWAV